jgi:hypothetical protein
MRISKNHSGSGSYLSKKTYVNTGSLEDLKIASLGLQQSCDEHLKFVFYLLGLVLE